MVETLERILESLERSVRRLARELSLKEDPLGYRYVILERKIARDGSQYVLIRAVEGPGGVNSRILGRALSTEEKIKADVFMMFFRASRYLEEAITYLKAGKRAEEGLKNTSVGKIKPEGGVSNEK